MLGKLRLLISEKTFKDRLKQEAAKSIQRFYRNWKARHEAWKKGKADIMEVILSLNSISCFFLHFFS